MGIAVSSVAGGPYIRKQLAHAPKDKVASAYDRAQFLAERRKMMQDWADYIDAMTKDFPKRIWPRALVSA